MLKKSKSLIAIIVVMTILVGFASPFQTWAEVSHDTVVKETLSESTPVLDVNEDSSTKEETDLMTDQETAMESDSVGEGSEVEGNQELPFIETESSDMEGDKNQNLTDTEKLESKNGSIGLYSTITGSKRIIDVFPDANVAAEIRSATGKLTTTSTITQSDLDRILIFSVEGKTVTRIEGIQYLRYATKISFQDTGNISDLTPLAGAGLTNLELLYIRNNQIKSLAPLATAGLTNLQELYVENNQISGDLSALSGMTKLKRFGAFNNQITSIDALANMPDLEYLWLANNQVSSTAPLAGLTKLQEVYIENNKLTNVEGMENKLSLRIFSAMYNKEIVDLSPLAGNLNLEVVFLRDNKISDVRPLENLTKIRELYLDVNHICDISSLSGLVNLTYLEVTNQTVTLSEVQYSTIVPLSVQDAVISKDGSFVPPNIISDSGSFISPNLVWNLPSGKTEVDYTWDLVFTGLGAFTGTITQPVSEKPTVDFTIKNEIINGPTTGSANLATTKMKYKIILTEEDGTTIIDPTRIGSGISSDGTFYLEEGQSITLKGLPGSTYTVVQESDTLLYDTEYEKVHGGILEEEGTLPTNKAVTGELKSGVNTLTFKNTYKLQEDFAITNYFLPDLPADVDVTYDIVLTYTDGSSSGDIYKGLTIVDLYEMVLEVGTGFEVTQSAISKYEPSAVVTEGDTAKEKIYGQVGDKITVSGIIGVGKNQVDFVNIVSEKLVVTNKDISKYPNIHQEFIYSITLDRTTQGSTQLEYTATRMAKDGVTVLETYTFKVGQAVTDIIIRDGESLVFSPLPIDITFEIIQNGELTYTTTATGTPADLITSYTGGVEGQGATVAGNMVLDGSQVDFVNKSTYTPPVTGVFDETSPYNTLIMITLAALVLLAGGSLYYRKKQKMYK